MGLLVSRLVFVGFVGLVGATIYNALYLQGPRHQAPVSNIVTSNLQSEATADGPMVVPVRTSPVPAVGSPSAELVRAVQRELAARGYSPGPADGEMREQTASAISAYQGDQGLPITGKPSDELLRQIVLGVSMEPEAPTGALVAPGSSAKVRTIQEVLAELGYAPGPIDGVMGASTRAAIKAFERDRNLSPKGEVSPELLAELKRVTGRDILM